MNVKEKIRKKFEKLQNAARWMLKIKSPSKFVDEQSGTDVAECIQKINALYHKSNLQKNTNNWRKMHGSQMRRRMK